MTIGERVRAERKSRGLSIAALSYESGCSETTLKICESGKSFPHAVTIGAIAKALDVSVDYIVYGKSVPTGNRRTNPCTGLYRRLRKAREDKDLTLQELAKQARISHVALSVWETNKGSPNILTLADVATALGVTLEYLIFG